MTNMLGGCRLVVGHHAEPRSECFKHHIAEGFGQARKQKHVARGVVTRQGFTPLGAAENRLGHIVFQFLALRAIADHDQFQRALGITRLEGIEGALEQAEILFRGQASDMNDGDVCLGQPPLLAQGIQAFGRVKQFAVDPSGQQRQSLELTSLQFQALADAGHQGHGRAVVEPAQVVSQQAREQTKPVLVGVLLEIGVETADHGNPQSPCRTQRRETQWALGGDVEHIRAVTRPAPQQFVHRRLTPLQAGIAR
ncbi:hypothetical protein D3C86_1460580 [compost metagenome]